MPTRMINELENDEKFISAIIWATNNKSQKQQIMLIDIKIFAKHWKVANVWIFWCTIK